MTRLGLAALVLAACVGDTPSGATPDATTQADASTDTVVEVTPCPATVAATVMTVEASLSFMPASTTVTQGQVVKFQMSPGHDVTPNTLTNTDPGLRVPQGQTKCLRFTKAGTFGFFCTPHGFTGTITVN